MKGKRRHSEGKKWPIKRLTSPMKHKMLSKSLSSKKNLLGLARKNTNSWTVVANERSSIERHQSFSNEHDESDDSRAIVVELPHGENSSSFFCGESSTFFNKSVARRCQEENRTASTPRFVFNSVESEDTDDSDVTPNYDSFGEAKTELLELSRDDDEDSVQDEQEQEETVEEDKIYVFEDKETVVAILRHPFEVVLCGQALVQSISGTVSIFGCQLNSSRTEPVHVFSSFNFSFLTLRTKKPEPNVMSPANLKYIKYQLTEIGAKSIANQVLSALDARSVVVALRRAPEIGSVQYACHLTPNLFGTPPLRSVFARPNFKKFGFSLVINSTCRKWSWNEDQDRLADHIVQYVVHAQSFGNTAPRVVVCGGKNVGKSTFLRFLINKTLNVCDKIIHLEGDPGQTEFTPAGCVSLTQVTKPLLGPAFTHPRTPESMNYVGGITVENNPDLYSSSVQQLIHYHRDHLANHPLFINTMGWTTGLGLSLLVDILRAAQPAIIVQFDCGESQASHNLPALNTDFLLNACGWDSSREMLGAAETELKILPPPSNQRKLAECVMPAVNLRNLAIFSYMGQLQKPHLEFQPINSFTPYSIPWSSVAVHFCHEDVSPEHVMNAINGSFVALCHVDSSKMHNSVIPEYPKCLTENPENKCYGFGLVRGINFRKKLFLVTTPEKLPILQEVNAFLIGSGKTPDQFFTTQDVQGQVPFMSEATIITSTGLTSPPKDRVYRERLKSRVSRFF